MLGVMKLNYLPNLRQKINIEVEKISTSKIVRCLLGVFQSNVLLYQLFL